MLHKLLLFLFFANIVDAVLTDLGLRTHHVVELNPLMDALYHHGVVWFYLVKIILSVAMLYIVPKAKEVVVVKSLFSVAGIVYLGTLALHSFWVVQFLS